MQQVGKSAVGVNVRYNALIVAVRSNVARRGRRFFAKKINTNLSLPRSRQAVFLSAAAGRR
jgi:hypothetical protein